MITSRWRLVGVLITTPSMLLFPKTWVSLLEMDTEFSGEGLAPLPVMIPTKAIRLGVGSTGRNQVHGHARRLTWRFEA